MFSCKNVKLAVICFGQPYFNTIPNNDQSIYANKGNLLLGYGFLNFFKEGLM